MRHDWTTQEVAANLSHPSAESSLLRARSRANFIVPIRYRTCHLVSIKTGGCPEDCAYCPQSAHYQRRSPRHGLMDVDEVIGRGAACQRAKRVTRLCMGAAWRDAPDRS